MISDLKEGVMRAILERNQREDEEAFQHFCEELLALPADLEFMPNKNFKADLELQPLRWMSLGVDLIRSRRVTGRVQLENGIEGPETGSYLPYAVFQTAAEIFLKGMWLCQFADCRELKDSSYVDPITRSNYQERLGSKGLGHDLLKIIGTVRGIPQYQKSAPTMRFLELIEGIIRRFYFPPYEADKRARWTHSRYPKRVYDDNKRCAHAESFNSYPNARWIEKLFEQAERDVDDLWQLRNGIASEQ